VERIPEAALPDTRGYKKKAASARRLPSTETDIY
jgi:hypothetical protein